MTTSRKRIGIIHAPSILGLRPTGVEQLPKALEEAGLHRKLGASCIGEVECLPYSFARDQDTMLLNGSGIHQFSLRLDRQIGAAMDAGLFPLVLGGDCSILIGAMLSLRRRGRYGLLFLDGHADFYQPQASSTGEVADMDLGIVTGCGGPAVISDIDGLKPYVREEDTVAFGFRDRESALQDGSQDILQSRINCFQLVDVRSMGLPAALSKAMKSLSYMSGFHVHLDVDVLSDEVMPAVDYRMPDGLTFEELSAVLQAAMRAGAVSMTVAIFNPTLDPTQSATKALVDALVAGLKPLEP